MYKLYWSEGTASLAPHAVLEEAGIDYELIVIDITAGEHRTSDFLQINPIGKVPALALPDGQVMYEAAAISLYLADHHELADLAPPISDDLRPLFLKSLFYLSSTVQDIYKRFYYPERYSSQEGDAAGIREQAIKHLIAAWKPVNDHLAANGPYHLGHRFSLVDIYAVMLVTWFDPQADLLDAFPALKTNFELIERRPAMIRCLSRQSRISVGSSQSS